MALDATETCLLDVEILGNKIVRLAPPGTDDADPGAAVVDATGLLLLPGLINAHDHLEFALFPRLGNGPYPNARAWAKDIYHPDALPIREHLAIPKRQRLHWGGVRNLMSGVTTVAHHNPYEAGVFDVGFSVRVVCRYGWAHSLGLTPDLRQRFEALAPDEPFLVHLGEGTDGGSRQEIYELDRLGALDARTVVIHGVAMGPGEIRLVERRGGSIVWCPSSNFFLLGKTLAPEVWNTQVPVALGTDSSLTSEAGLLDELRLAQGETGLAADRLYEMVTTTAARILCLRGGEGTIAAGAGADLLLVADRGGSPAECLLRTYAADIQMVVVAGQTKLVSGQAAARLDQELTPNLRRAEVAGRRLLLDVPLELAGTATLPGIGEIRFPDSVGQSREAH